MTPALPTPQHARTLRTLGGNLTADELTQQRAVFLDSIREQSNLWVFGYGSLMWKPGFTPTQTLHATIFGYHRSLCITSWEYRGSPAQPGLVMGLKRGGQCHGMVLKLPPAQQLAIAARLWDREMITGVYRPTLIQSSTPCQTNPIALTFVACPQHRQFVPALTFEETLALVRQGVGRSGTCVDYVIQTRNHLKACGIHTPALEKIVRRLIVSTQETQHTPSGRST